MPKRELAEVQQRQAVRRNKEEERAKRKLREKFRQAAKNIRGMRSYSGRYGIGPRLRRSFKELKNEKYIEERRGERALITENKELKSEIRSLRSFQAFLISNGMISMLTDDLKVKPKFRIMLQTLRDDAQRNSGNELGSLRNLISQAPKSEKERPRPNQSAFTPEPTPETGERKSGKK